MGKYFFIYGNLKEKNHAFNGYHFHLRKQVISHSWGSQIFQKPVHFHLTCKGINHTYVPKSFSFCSNLFIIYNLSHCIGIDNCYKNSCSQLTEVISKDDEISLVG